MTLPDSNASATSDRHNDAVTTELDNVFVPPLQSQWIESALAGLSPDTTLESLAHETLDGLNIAVLYDTAPASIASGALYRNAADGWDNRLVIDRIDDPEKTNQHILQALAAGNTSVELRANAQSDFTTLLRGVILDVAHISLRAGHDFASTAENFSSYCKQQNLDASSLRCSFNADPVGEWLVNGEAGASIEQALTKLGDFAHQTHLNFPNAATVLVDATIHHNAGASATQELTAAIATATVYLETLTSAGMTLDQASRQIVFQMACDQDVLMGVIKLRTLTHLWQHVLTQFRDSTEPSSAGGFPPPMALVVETSRRNQSRTDYWNNHLRNLAACTAAAMGNATSIIVHPHDRMDGWSASDDQSLGERMARNLPIILDREAGLIRVNDPFRGSHAIETLTAQLAEKTWQALIDMSNAAGWLQAIRSGNWQRAIADMHAKRVDRLHAGKQVMVGVNRYAATSQSATATATATATAASASASASASADHHTTARSSQASPPASTDSVLLRVRDAETFNADSTVLQHGKDSGENQ